MRSSASTRDSLVSIFSKIGGSTGFLTDFFDVDLFVPSAVGAGFFPLVSCFALAFTFFEAFSFVFLGRRGLDSVPDKTLRVAFALPLVFVVAGGGSESSESLSSRKVEESFCLTSESLGNAAALTGEPG